MTPDEHASQAEELLAESLRGNRTSRRAAVLATAALAHAQLALYRDGAGALRAGPTGHGVERSRPNGVPRPQPVAAPMGETLFARLKGTDGIAAVVGDFYRKVCRDMQLAHYFERTPVPFLQRHMVAFLVQATGGPKEYRGRAMLDAHEHLRITGRDFDRVADHLVATLQEHGIEDADIEAVARAIAPLRPVIVTQGRPTFPG